MSRGLEIDGRDSRRLDMQLARALAEPRDPRRRSATIPTPAFRLPSGLARERVRGPSRTYRLRGSESGALVTVGTFRVVFERDLQDGPYRGDARRLGQDMAALTAKGLLQRRTVACDAKGHGMGVLALTRDGQALLERHRSKGAPSSRHQAVHAGWSKPRELVHDASIYRMYQVEAAAIEARGGVVRRVVLDEELKREVYGQANRIPAFAAHLGSDRLADVRVERLEEAATRVSLPVVDGHVEFPDLRIEYDDPVLGQTRVDLELVSDAYHKGHVAAKQRAGFALYSAGGDAARGIRSLGGSGSSGRGGTLVYLPISSLLSL